MLSLTTAQASSILKAFIAKAYNVLLAGAPGCGKSAIVIQAAKELGYECAVFHPVVSDPTDFKGFPWVNKDTHTAEFVPFGEFARLLTAKKPTVAFMDDVGHAPKAVQATLMQPLFARTLNGHKIPDCVSFVLATNRRGDKAGVEGIIDPIISRCHGVYEIKPDLDTFLTYWIGSGKRPEVYNYLQKWKPDHLYIQKKTADIENYPCYRTWDFANDIVGLGLPSDLELNALAGALGAGVAGEFFTYLAKWRELPDPDEVFKNPAKAPIPKKPDMQYAYCAAVAFRCTVQTFPAIAAYTERLSKEGYEEIAMCLLGDSLRRCPDDGVRKSKQCLDLLNGRLGRMLTGK